MSLLEEAIFERLYPRYARAFGEPPPFQTAKLDEAVAYMRSRLRAHANETARNIGARRWGEMNRQRPGPARARAAA